MSIGHEGMRRRYFHERLKVEEQVGNPIRREVSLETRARLMREVRSMTEDRSSSAGPAAGQGVWVQR